MQLISDIQKQLEALYQIELGFMANDYLVSKNQARQLLNLSNRCETIGREYLFVSHSNDVLEIALFLDPKLLQNLETNSPYQSLNQKNLDDFCILIEGISHFVYTLTKAKKNHSITELELELQAEVDKYFLLLSFLRSDDNPLIAGDLFGTLFDKFQIMQDISQVAHDRYLSAFQLAARYCYRLQKKIRNPQDLIDITKELRHFYHLNQQQKIDVILQ